VKAVEDALQRLDGVEGVFVDLQAGKVTLAPRPSARIKAPVIFEALRHAGFRGDAVTFEATGAVKRSGPACFLLPGSSESWLTLPEPAPPDGPARIRARIVPGGQVELLPAKEGGG
jgi:hypothetical protein